LSDFDRIEECWDTEILPILTGETNIEDVASRLIEIANTKNGHDNVTIALVHYQVKYCEPDIKLTAQIPTVSTSKTVDLTSKNTNDTSLGNSQQQTQVISEQQASIAGKFPLQLIILLMVLLVAGSMGYWLHKQKLEVPANNQPNNQQSPVTPPPVIPKNPTKPVNPPPPPVRNIPQSQ
jgi:protein phosphatase